MRRAFFLIVLVGCWVQSIAQQQTPSIQINKSLHNFGDIQEVAGPVSTVFDISNNGSAPLIITRVASSCSCSATEWTKEPILPGAKGSITVSYNPAGRPGPFSQRITLYTNANTNGNVLTIRGQVIPRPKTVDDIYRKRIGDIGVTNSHLSMGAIVFNKSKSDTLKYYNFGEKTIAVSLAEVPKHITYSINPTEVQPKKEGYIVFTFNPSGLNDWGYTVSRVRLLLDKKNPDKGGNIISISGRIEEDFTSLTEKELANAPRIEFTEVQKDFGNVNEGDVIKHDFIFTNTGKSDLIIRKIQASCGCTTVAPSITLLKAGEKSSLSAQFKTSGFTGRQSKTITVITNDPKSPNIVLRLTGTVVKKE